MHLSTILCPLDFSAATSGLVAYAAALAVATGAELRLLHVCEQQETNYPERMAEQRVAAELAGVMHVSTNVLRGEAAPQIVAEASRRHADLIVIGAHGQTGLTRFLMGNTAEEVVRTARCATMLVRAPTQLSER